MGQLETVVLVFSVTVAARNQDPPRDTDVKKKKERSFSTVESFTLINTFIKTTPHHLQPHINTYIHIKLI